MKFRLFRKDLSLAASGLMQGYVDWHSHILPGVDDGVPTVREALDILSLYETLGVRSVWLTPHVMEDIPNTPAFLHERFAALRAAYSGPVALHLASEHMLDQLFTERLARKAVLPLGRSQNHLLVETSYFNPPLNFRELLARIRQAGYYPVLAHPERYVYLDLPECLALKREGVKFQMNLFSRTGYYGDAVRRKADRMWNASLYDLTGTDVHAMRQLLQGRICRDMLAYQPLKDL